MKKNTINFIIDLIAFIDLLAITFTGVIMKFVLPPGTGGRHRLLTEPAGLGRNFEQRGSHIKELWTMSRHQWGHIHYILASIFIILMILHIVMHWKWIKNRFCPKCEQQQTD